MWYVVPNWHVYATYHFLAEPVCHLLARILLCQWSQVWTFQVWKHYFEQRCQFHSHILQWASPLYLQYTFLWWLWSLLKFKKSISFSRIGRITPQGILPPSIGNRGKTNWTCLKMGGPAPKPGAAMVPGRPSWNLSAQGWLPGCCRVKTERNGWNMSKPPLSQVCLLSIATSIAFALLHIRLSPPNHCTFPRGWDVGQTS